MKCETTVHTYDAFCPLTQAWHVNCPFNCPSTLSNYKHDKIDIITSFVFPFFVYDKNHKMLSKIFFSLKEIADDFYNTYNGHHYNLLEDEVGEKSSKKRSYQNALEGLCIK